MLQFQNGFNFKMLSLVRHSSYKFSFILSVIAYLTEAWWSDTPLVLYNEKNSSSPKYFHYFWRNYSDRRINQYNEDEVQIWFLFLTSMNAQKHGKNEKLSIYSFFFVNLQLLFVCLKTSNLKKVCWTSKHEETSSSL